MPADTTLWHVEMMAACEADTTWLRILRRVNHVHGLYVHTSRQTEPQVLKPMPKSQDMSKTALKQFLSAACEGVQEVDLLKVRKEPKPHSRSLL
jgi:hypothetical protein